MSLELPLTFGTVATLFLFQNSSNCCFYLPSFPTCSTFSWVIPSETGFPENVHPEAFHPFLSNTKPGCIKVNKMTAIATIPPSRIINVTSLFASSLPKPSDNSATRKLERMRIARVANASARNIISRCLKVQTVWGTITEQKPPKFLGLSKCLMHRLSQRR